MINIKITQGSMISEHALPDAYQARKFLKRLREKRDSLLALYSPEYLDKEYGPRLNGQGKRELKRIIGQYRAELKSMKVEISKS